MKVSGAQSFVQISNVLLLKKLELLTNVSNGVHSWRLPLRSHDLQCHAILKSSVKNKNTNLYIDLPYLYFK